MRILISGYTGFIGSNLVDALKDDHEVLGISREKSIVEGVRAETVNLADSDSIFKLEELMLDFQPQVVFHLAGIASPSRDSNDIIKTNIIGTNNLLQSVPKGTHLVFASSIVVYKKNWLPNIESSEIGPKSVYGASKISGEDLVQIYSEQNSFTYTICRLGATIGPNMTHGLINDLLRKIKLGGDLELFGDAPGSSKTYTAVSRVVNAFKKIIEKRPENQVYNICNPGQVSVEDVAYKVMTVLGERPIKWLGNKFVSKGDNNILTASPVKAVSEKLFIAGDSLTDIEEFARHERGH